MDRLIVLILVGIAYAARPLSCVVARRVAGTANAFAADPLAAGFDFDGTVAGLGTLLALLFAVPVLRVALLILRPPIGGVRSTRDPNRALAVQGIAWAALAAPTFSQMQYLAALPGAATRPIAVAAIGWAAVAAILWWAARRRDGIMDAIARPALIVGALTALPKLLLLPSLLILGG